MTEVEDQIYSAIIIGLISCCLYAIYWYGYGRFQYFKKRGIPYMKAQWFIGNSANVRKPGKSPYEVIYDTMNDLKTDTFGLFFWGLPMFATRDVKIVREMNTSKFDCFRDRMMFHDRPHPYNLMIGWMIGDRWKTLRGKLSPLFSNNKLKLMMEIMRNAASTCVDILEESAKSKKTACLTKIGNGFSVESILSLSFGVEAKSQTETNVRIRKLSNTYFDGQGVLWHLMQWLPLSEYYMKYVPNPMVTAAKEMYKEVEVLFAQRKAGNAYRDDLLQYMLATQTQKYGMSDDEVLSSAINLMTAGQENTGTSVSTALYELAKNPEYQERLYQELKLQWQDTSKPLSFEELESLKFLDMFVKEVLRYYPPGPGFLRACKRGCEINGIKFEPYTYVAISIYSIHRDPKAYERPFEFYPDHFSEEASKRRDEYSWIPFGCGPRICLGYKFAMLEIKIALSMIIRKIKLTPAEGFPEKLTFKQRITNIITYPIPCLAEKRKE